MGTCLSKGDQVSRYRIEELLNDGAYALSYRAVDITDPERQVVFLKQYKSPSVRSGWYRGYVSYEAEIRRRIEENGLTGKTSRFLDFFESRDSGQKAYYQVFEFVSQGRDLQAQLEDPVFRWEQRWTFSKLMLSTLHRLHGAGIVHCDLKPENLFLQEDFRISVGYQLKVIDFDHSLLADKEAPWVGFENYAGTPGYLSPEHLRGDCPTAASDVFTCGLILYQLLCQDGHPYDLVDQERYAEQVLSYQAPMPRLLRSVGSSQEDQALCCILRQCLDPIAARRPGMQQLHQALLLAGQGARQAPLPVVSVTFSPPAFRQVTWSPSQEESEETPEPPAPPVQRFRKINEEPETPSYRPAPPEFPRPAPPEFPRPAPPEFVRPDASFMAGNPGFGAEVPQPPTPSEFIPVPKCGEELVLTGPNGQSASLHIETRIGKHFLSRFGEDAKYYSELQFTIYREPDGWYVNPNPAAQNQSILNGKLLEGPCQLLDGDVLCVGNLQHGVTKLPLTVSIPM